MNILVTGGAGFIGSHLVDALIAGGQNEVTVIDDLSSGQLDNLPDTVRFFQQDIADGEAHHTIKQLQPDVVIHAAAQMSVSASMRDPQRDLQVNLLGTVNVLQAVKDFPKKPYLLFISTGGALYGEQEQFPADEQHKLQPTSIYGQSKACAEEYLALYKRVYDVPYGVLRLANVYGPRQNPHGEAGVVAIFLEKLLAGDQPIIFGSGEFTRDYVYVADVVSAALKMIGGNVEDTFNIGTGRETSVNDLYSIIAQATGTELEAQHQAQRAGDQERSVITAQKASESLNWEPQTSLVKGIELTSAWYQNNSE